MASSLLIFEPIPVTLLNTVRAQALGSDALWSALEQALYATPAECLARLGATLGLDTLGMEALHRLPPDFSVLPYSEALRRKCLIARQNDNDEDKALICIFSDPFDLALPTWVETRLGATPEWRLAHPSDLVAYLARRQPSGAPGQFHRLRRHEGRRQR